MARPEINEDQRIVAVTMLANAIRKAEQPRRRGGAASGDPVLDLVGRRREEAARQYVRGMHDLLAVLFAGGRPGADALVAAARAMAFGERPPESGGVDGNGAGRPTS